MKGKIHKLFHAMKTGTAEGRKPYWITFCGNTLLDPERVTVHWNYVSCAHCLKHARK